MLLQQAITERRSVKQFDPAFKMSDTDLELLLSNAMLAPTSFNIQHWRFVNVVDAELRNKIRSAAWDQAQVTEASALIIVTADIQAWHKQPDRYWESADEDKRQYIVNMIREFYEGRAWIQRDEAIRSGAMAAQNLMLTAKSLGYDACPMIGFDQEVVAELIQLPTDHAIVMMVAIGKAVSQAWPRGGQLPLSQVLVKNTFTTESALP